MNGNKLDLKFIIIIISYYTIDIRMQGRKQIIILDIVYEINNKNMTCWRLEKILCYVLLFGNAKIYFNLLALKNAHCNGLKS